jgi:SAM-dependent methyltransferase
MERETRVYGKIVDLDGGSVQDFWNAKAQKDDSLKSVLLGSDFAEDSGIRRNKRETDVLLRFLGGKKDITVLDIGCGIGRWAHNLKGRIKAYHGIDFSAEFIKSARKNFETDDRMRFFNMPAPKIDASALLNCYDLVIITGVAMYINDNDMEHLFYHAGKLNHMRRGGGGDLFSGIGQHSGIPLNA